MSQPRDLPPRRAEAGSAYIIALLVLVVLSILGLGLALITQTEMQIGANEITLQRALYAADSGLSRSFARTFQHYSCSPIPGTEFEIGDQDLSPLMLGSGLRENVDVTASVPLMNPPCPLCTVNNAAGSQESGEQDYYEVHHVLSARASRRIGTDLTTPTLAERRVGGFFSLQPWPQVKDCYEFLGSPQAAEVDH